jgi:vacuolar-type H+-ATPase subunit H
MAELKIVENEVKDEVNNETGNEIKDESQVNDKIYQITEADLNLLKAAVNQAINLCQRAEYPAVFEYLDKDNKITTKAKDKVKRVINQDRTFSQENLTLSYDASKITLEILSAREFLETL